MNEEEKQAYDYLEKYIEWETSGERNLEEDIKTILNLINKQQKEIEDLKNDHIDFWINTKEVEDMVRGKFISKDKIEAKIEKIKEDEKFYRERDRMYEFNGKINILKELLGE